MQTLMELHDLEKIIDYDMTPDEAEAYKSMLLYTDFAFKALPNYRHYFYKKNKGDPRKKELFKYCYKMIKEVKPKLKPGELHLFIRAQFEVLKAFSKNNDHNKEDFFIQPNCLVGEHAWRRWMRWKKVWEQVQTERRMHQNKEETPVEIAELCKQLKITKDFMEKRLGPLDNAKIQSVVDNRTMLRWVATKQVTPYYPIMSPIFQAWLAKNSQSLDSLFYIDFNKYRPHITDQLIDYFKQEFVFEF